MPEDPGNQPQTRGAAGRRNLPPAPPKRASRDGRRRPGPGDDPGRGCCRADAECSSLAHPKASSPRAPAPRVTPRGASRARPGRERGHLPRPWHRAGSLPSCPPCTCGSLCGRSAGSGLVPTATWTRPSDAVREGSPGGGKVTVTHEAGGGGGGGGQSSQPRPMTPPPRPPAGRVQTLPRPPGRRRSWRPTPAGAVPTPGTAFSGDLCHGGPHSPITTLHPKSRTVCWGPRQQLVSSELTFSANSTIPNTAKNWMGSRKIRSRNSDF